MANNVAKKIKLKIKDEKETRSQQKPPRIYPQ